MKNRIFLYFVPLLLLLFVSFSATAAEVSQGKCVRHDKEKGLITLEEYDTKFDRDYPYGHPTGETRDYNVSKALIGLAPEPGDILRIAYEAKGNEKVAFKVMNVSKQDLMKK